MHVAVLNENAMPHESMVAEEGIEGATIPILAEISEVNKLGVPKKVDVNVIDAIPVVENAVAGKIEKAGAEIKAVGRNTNGIHSMENTNAVE